jgi:hypothetical protein
MAKLNRQNVCPAIAFLACAGVLWIHLDNFEASEFSGGWLSGKILMMADIGVLLLFSAMVLTIFVPRAGAIVALVAIVLCFPFYLYVVVPGPYRRIFQGEYSFPLQREFAWNSWAIAGIVTLIFAALFSVRSLSRRSSS